MHILLIFIDGIGLGDNNPDINPFAVMNTPTLHALAGGHRWLNTTGRIEAERSIFLPTDPRVGVAGRPQSASGQAMILTGRNIPQEIGEHYGPRPNQPIREILTKDNLFITLAKAGKSAALITPYPPQFFAALERGKRLPSSIQFSVLSAGLSLKTRQDYDAGNAISPDWTGEGWRTHLNFPDAPLYTPEKAGQLLAKLAGQYTFSMFSTWITDEIGHRGPFEKGVAFMERTDRVIKSLLDNWSNDDGLIVITSDHGNMEVQGNRRHSENDVPTIAIGKGREFFAENFSSLMDITPGILCVLDRNA